MQATQNSIQVTKTKIWTQADLTFGDYQKLDGFSHSDIRAMMKAGQLKHHLETPKMALGTQVHHYLLEPHKYEHSSQEVKKIAMKLKEAIGEELLELLEPELSVQAVFSYNNFSMLWKGRIDLAIRRRLVVDLKIINSESVRQTMDWFGYPNQLNGYGLGIEAQSRIIAAYSTKTKKVELVPVPLKLDWWQEQINLLGK